MNMLRSLIVATLLALGLATPAYSQCSGQFANNTFCGYTGGAAKGLPVPTTVPAGSLSPIAAYTVLGNPTGSTATPIATNQPIVSTSGTEGYQFIARSSSATTGRAGVFLQQTGGGGAFSMQQDIGGNVYLQNAGTANLISFYDAVGNNYLRFNGGAALANTRVSVLSTQTSTSSTTGALTVAGGIGTTGPVFVSGNVVVGSTGGGGTLFFGNNTGTGQISALAVNNTDNALYMYSRGTGGIRWQNLANTTIMALTDGGVLTLTQGVASSSTSTGTLVINGSGGLGVGGAIFGGSTLTVAGDSIVSRTSAGGIVQNLTQNGGTTASTTARSSVSLNAIANSYLITQVYTNGAGTQTGQIVVGTGVSNLIYSSPGHIFTAADGITQFATLSSTRFYVPLTTASTSSSTGAIVTAGGIGATGDIFTANSVQATGLVGGSNIWVTGDIDTAKWNMRLGAFALSFQSDNTDTTVTAGCASNQTIGGRTYRTKACFDPTGKLIAQTATFLATTASSSTTTGAVTVAGGVGIVGDVNIGGNLTAASITGTVNISGLTASRLVATDGSSNLTSTITSANMAASISDETGSGSAVFATSPTLVTPVLGVATATSINKVAITAPATSATLTIANGKTLTASNTLTFTGTDGSSVAFGTGGTVTYTVASGTSALGTSAISAGTCATVVTTSATGTATTDVVDASFNGDPTAVTGYTPGAMLSIVSYPSANNVNFKVCNNTSGSITPGAITLNWKVRR